MMPAGHIPSVAQFNQRSRAMVDSYRQRDAHGGSYHLCGPNVLIQPVFSFNLCPVSRRGDERAERIALGIIFGIVSAIGVHFVASHIRNIRSINEHLDEIRQYRQQQLTAIQDRVASLTQSIVAEHRIHAITNLALLAIFTTGALFSSAAFIIASDALLTLGITMVAAAALSYLGYVLYDAICSNIDKNMETLEDYIRCSSQAEVVL